MSLQPEALYPLWNGKTPQAHHKEVCGIGSRSQFKYGTDATPVWINQQLDESKLVDSLANKAPISHKAMLISQGFNPETGDLETFIEHCERADTTEDIAMAKFSSSYE